ncbi:tat pathway signal sequence [Hypoxylon fuscum]|nr:tat pathway signal sequence [Hypoxylon fuscum]
MWNPLQIHKAIQSPYSITRNAWKNPRNEKHNQFYADVLLSYTCLFSSSTVLSQQLSCSLQSLNVNATWSIEAVSQRSIITFDAPLHGNSVFRGTPREELHEAWSELLQYHNIRVPESDLRRINRTSLPLNDEDGGFLVTLEVFHQLHCLNQLRQQIYHDYYYPAVENWNSSKRFEHVDHCVDLLRQVLMCQGDVSLLTYNWVDDYRRPWPKFDVDHTCRNWDSVQKWAKQHNIPSLKGSILLHPVLGPAWPEDEDGDHDNHT